jgi:hypothetical protein
MSSTGSADATVVSKQALAEGLAISAGLTIAYDWIPFPHGALLLSPLLEPGYVFGVHHSSSQDELRLFGRAGGLALPHRLDHEHVLGRLDVLGIEVPLLQLRLVLLLARYVVVSQMVISQG